MAVRINIPTAGPRTRMVQQLSIVHAVLCVRQTKEMRVLAYMVRHAVEGMYVIRRGYRIDIAKSLGISPVAAKRILAVLSEKGLICYVSNQQGNNFGVYTFHPAIGALATQQDELIFKFVPKK